jgi:hypothetical protein
MRRGPGRYIVACVLALAVALPGGARPAQAVDIGTITAVINAGRAAYGLWKDFTGGGKDLEEATALIIAEIDKAEAAILSHIDLIAAAEARACSRHAVVELADIDTFDQTTMRSWAQQVTACVTLIDSLASTVGDQAAIDQLGFALNSVGPIALVARARAGFTTTALTAVLIAGNTTIASRIDPPCPMTTTKIGWTRTRFTWTCTAHNGDSSSVSLEKHVTEGRTPPPTPDLLPHKTHAARNTSEPLALSVIPFLQTD